MSKRIAKEITNKEDIDFLLSIKEEDITSSFMMKTFGEFQGKQRFHPYDTFKVPANSYGPDNNRNTNTFTTTVGLWVFNKYFIERELFTVFKYINHPIDKKAFGKLNSQLSYAVLEDDIELQVLKNFIQKTQFFMPFVSILSPSMTEKMLTSTKAINKKKAELAKKYDKAIKEGDAVLIEKMEKELLSFAKEYLKDDPSMDSFDSGARGSFGNNFKNMFVTKGAISDPDPNKGYNIVMSNYMDGVSKDEYSALANSLAEGPYARGKKTEVGGYYEKLFIAAFQHITLDEEGTDCGTDKYLEIILENPNDWMYSYIIEGNHLVELNSKNVDKYKGKKVKIRFSSLCKSKTGICNKCAGNLFYKLGIRNVGTALPTIPSTLKLAAMKSFHQSVIKMVEMDPAKAFGTK